MPGLPDTGFTNEKILQKANFIIVDNFTLSHTFFFYPGNLWQDDASPSKVMGKAMNE